MAFAEFLVDPETQELIGEFGVDKYRSAAVLPRCRKRPTPTWAYHNRVMDRGIASGNHCS